MKANITSCLAALGLGALLLATASCGNKQEPQEKAPDVPDSTLRVVLLDRTDSTLHVRLLSDSTEHTYTYAAARRDKALHGPLTAGDTLALVEAPGHKDLRSVVNVTSLAGFWLFDGQDGNGMRLLSDGAAENVGTANVGLRSWRMKNGQLLITYLPADGSHLQEQTDTSELRVLNDTTLTLTLRGHAYTCHRHSGLITAP